MTIIPVQTASPIVLDDGVGTVERLAAAWLLGYGPRTRDGYGRDLRAWLSFLADRGVDPLAAKRAHVDAYARQLAEVDHRAPSTVARHLSALASFYAYLTDEDVLGASPVAKVRRPKVSTDSPRIALERSELAALIEVARKDGPRSYALVELLAMTGLRISEALGLDVSDLGEERGHQTVCVTRKGGKRAVLAVPPRSAVALQLYLAGRMDGPVFVTRTGATWTRHQADRTIRRLVATAVPAKAGKISAHSLRHTYTTCVIQGGAELQHVQASLGHASPTTTMRYYRRMGELDKSPAYLMAGLV